MRNLVWFARGVAREHVYFCITGAINAHRCGRQISPESRPEIWRLGVAEFSINQTRRKNLIVDVEHTMSCKFVRDVIVVVVWVLMLRNTGANLEKRIESGKRQNLKNLRKSTSKTSPPREKATRQNPPDH